MLFFSSDILWCRNVSDVSLGFRKTSKLQKWVSRLPKEKSNSSLHSLSSKMVTRSARKTRRSMKCNEHIHYPRLYLCILYFVLSHQLLMQIKLSFRIINIWLVICWNTYNFDYLFYVSLSYILVLYIDRIFS